MKKIGIASFCCVFILCTLFFYWHTFSKTAVEPIASVTHPTPASTLKTLPTTPRLNTELTTEPLVESPVLDTDETSESPKELAKAIDFLETLEEQSQQAKSGNKTEHQTSGNTTQLSQNEMFQLIREGTSYYDSLLESGSVTFFAESWSREYPGEQRAPTGTLEGTFEFSGNRFRSFVRKNMTYYEENGYPRSRQTTYETAFDGETYERLHETQLGTVLERKSQGSRHNVGDPRFWGWNLSGNEKGFAEMINSLEVQHIEVAPSKENDPYYIKGKINSMEVELWINPEASFRPERYSFATKNENTEYRVTKEFSFREVAPDLWFPESGSDVVTITDLKTGVKTDISGGTYSLSNVRINEHMPSKRFSIPPRQGITVADKRTRTTYEVE